MSGEILIGARSISYYLHVRMDRVREYEQRGAPIYRDEGGRMRAEKGEILAWVMQNVWTRKNCQVHAS